MPAHRPLEERFWEKVSKGEGCWEWTAGRHTQGYGMIVIERRNTPAHRVSYELAHGPIPDSLHVLHKCDNPPCVRPDHLFLGTHADNMRDARNKNRLVAHRGSKHGCAKLTEKQIGKIRATYSFRGMNGGWTLKELAAKYGVTFHAIWRIVARKTWQHCA